MKRVFYLFAISGLFLSLYSCSVSIDGGPCDPEKNNCPSGQYCSEEGICKPGSPQMKDVTHINDVSEIKDFKDIGDVEDSGIEGDVSLADISDVVIEDTGDIGDIGDNVNDAIEDDVITDTGDVVNIEDSGVDVGEDAGCNINCGDNASCINGSCVCNSGYANCDSDWGNGCEVNTKEDPKNCNSCGNDCGSNSLCNDGVCGCVNNYMNCDGKWSNGCEVDLTSDSNNCGDCGKSCNQNAYCSNSSCICNSPFANCDNDWGNGCEVNLSSDIERCGDCQTDCTKLDNVNTVSCSNGGCVIYNCKTGYDDCDNDVSNGCEVNLSNNPNHCGSCVIDCGANTICESGQCGCSSNFTNCNNLWTDGCEVNLTNDPNNCGNCGNKCNQNADCSNSSCICKSPFANCDNDWGNGCEVDLNNDLNNCGNCGYKCTPANVHQAFCIGLCTYDYCNEYFIDKNGSIEDGCEYWTNFPKRYDNNTLSDLPSVILDADDGNLFIVGRVNNNMRLFKVDRYGEIIWQKAISFNSVAHIQKGMRVIDDRGDLIGFLLAGEISISSDRRDILIIYLNTDGSIKFARNYFEEDQGQRPKNNKYKVYDIEHIRSPLSEKSFLIVGDYFIGNGSDPHPFYLRIYDSGVVLNSFTYKYNTTNNQIIGQFSGVKIKPDISDQVFITGLYTDPISSITDSLLVGKVDNTGNSNLGSFYYYADISVANMLLVPSTDGYDFYLIGTTTNNKGVSILLDYKYYDTKFGPVEISAIDADGNNLNLFFSSAINIPTHSSPSEDRLFASGGIVTNSGSITNAIATKIQADLSIDIMKTIYLNGGVSITEDMNIDLTNILDSLFLVAPYKFNGMNDILAVKLLATDLSVPDASCAKNFIGDLEWKAAPLTGVRSSLPVQQVSITIGSSDWKPTIYQGDETSYNVCNKP